jgi:hypothetical protein
VALAVVVLTVAGLAIRGLMDKQRIDPGFQVDHVLLMSFNPGLVRYDQPQTRAFYQELVARTRVLPGVSAAGLAQFLLNRVQPFSEGAIYGAGFSWRDSSRGDVGQYSALKHCDLV